MTKWLWLFLTFYILVGQPALLWWMLNNCSLYQLAWLNAWVFIIARIISALCKPNKPKASKDNTAKVIEKSEEKISRIENDNGVAVVSVEKKEEVVVETSKSEENQPIAEWLVENKEEKSEETIGEKLGEKSEEKIPERPMRESVTIPKIVQPLSWHQTSKKKNKELRWWQRLILLLTLGIAAVIARTLREFLWSWWIAIALFLGRILYLVIWKLFDVNGFYNAKKLFTNWLYIILIIVWICYGIYTTKDDSSFNLIKDKAISYVQNRFNLRRENNTKVDTWDVIYVFEWTWEVVSITWNMEILANTWGVEETWIIEGDTWTIEDEIEFTEIGTWTVESISDTVPRENKEEEKISNLSLEEASKKVTMWEAIKSLLAWAKLSTKTNVAFKYVAKSNELYPYFKTAQEKWMIGTDTDPNKLVSCDTYITLKWLREWRNVGNYTKSNVKTVYWNKAVELWKLNWCKKWAYVTKWNL